MGAHDTQYIAEFQQKKGMKEQVARVQKLLLPMDMPAFRRDVSQPANVRWLIRNLGVRNSKRAAFKTVVKELVRLHHEFKL